MSDILFPLEREVTDVYDLKRVKDTEWTWYNLFQVLSNLVPAVEVIPTDSSERQSLAFEWDSNMAFKYFSPYMMNWTKDHLTESNIADFLKVNFLDKWNKLYDVMQQEYDALSPYNITEEEHTDDVKDETKGKDKSSSLTVNRDIDVDTSENVDNKIYGFDSNVGVDNTSSSSTGGTTTNDDLTNSFTEDTDETYTTDNDLDRTLTRTGNTGNIFPQQLIDAEWETRKKLVLDVIRDDIYSIMTLTIY